MNTKGSVKVGELEELAHPIQRYLLPLQSVEQVLAIIVCVTVCVSVLFAYDTLVDGSQMPIHVWIVITICSFAGTLPAWTVHLPVRFVISANNDTQKLAVIQFLKEKAGARSFNDITQLPDEIVLSVVYKKLKGIGKWLGWLAREQNKVHIAPLGTNVRVTGPAFFVRYLRKISVIEFGTAENTSHG
jgi:hypothetical protein